MQYALGTTELHELLNSNRQEYIPVLLNDVQNALPYLFRLYGVHDWRG